MSQVAPSDICFVCDSYIIKEF